MCHPRFRSNVKRILDEPDEELPVLLFERDGRPVGAVVCYALHQCTVREEVMGYSGDYAAILSEKLKERYGNGFVTLFLLGTCGDVNHNPHDINIPVPHHTEVGARLADYIQNSVDAAAPLGRDGVATAITTVTVPRRSAEYADYKDQLAHLLSHDTVPMRIRNLLAYVSVPQPASSELTVQCIRIGDVLIACLPGELYTALGRRIKQESPFAHTIVVENCNSACGYIPTADVFASPRNDLYETTLCAHSCLAPEAGDMIVDAALSLASSLSSLA